MHTPPLRKRVIAGSLAVLALSFLLLDSVVYSALDRHLEANLEAILEQRVALVRELAAVLAPEELHARLDELGVRAVITLPDGRMLRAQPDPLTEQGSTGPGEDPGGDYLERRVVGSGGLGISVAVPRSGVVTTKRQLLLVEAVATAVALCFAASLLAHTTSNALRPVQALAATARSISGGRLGDRLRPDRPETDLGAMAHAFDDMVDRLSDALRSAQEERHRASASEERARRFLADAAHQLRTPVTGISTSVDTLLRSRTDEHRERALAHLVRETDRAVELVHDLLKLARLGEPPGSSPAGVVEVLPAVREEIARCGATERGLVLRLRVDTSATSPVVLGDERALCEAFANVLENAVRHARTEIAVEVAATGEEVRIDVRDDGPGVAVELRPTVFDRFATYGEHGGAGLGLAIARAITRRHGGEITCGQGGFSIVLPRGDPTVPGAAGFHRKSGGR